MSTTPILEVTGLLRHFDDVRAVDGVSFAIEPGQVVGLIGANGAGKTTVMRILATLDLPDGGTVFLDGVDIVECPNRVRPRIGWMPDHFQPYKETTVGDYLDFFARAQGLGNAELVQRVQETAEFTDLAPLADRLIDRLSKGQMQRLCLARTLVKDPDFLILDEPAAGLDPRARLEFKNLVRLLRERGKTILISSHILSELGEMCDSLIFMDRGRVMHHGNTEALRRNDPGLDAHVITIRVEGDPAPLLAWLSLQQGWKLREELRDGARAEFTAPGGTPVPQSRDPAKAGATLGAELRRMIADGIVVAEFHRAERRLEETFVDMLREPPK